MFLVDQSGSIYLNDLDELGGNWRDITNFMVEFCRGLTIGPDNVQISVVIFSDGAETVITFNNNERLLVKLANLEYGRGGDNTNTVAGLEEVMDNAFTIRNGHRISKVINNELGLIIKGSFRRVEIIHIEQLLYINVNTPIS